MKEVIANLKQSMVEQKKNADPGQNKMVDDMRAQDYQAKTQQYQKDLAKWNADYPASPAPMIRRWLKEYLALSGEVDFSAQLQSGEYGKKVFVKQEYEQKSDRWKMCFRAGKEAADAGRAYAQQWLKELGN